MAQREEAARSGSRIEGASFLSGVDPITFEIIRHRLWCIQGECAATVKAMSGSPIVSEGGDFNTAIMAADGTCLLMGVYVGAHAATQATVVRSILADYGPEFVRDGDMFICNDPWKGALHQNDVACVAPVFVDGELMAWVGSVLHQLDVGGPAIGGFNVRARSVHDEALPMPPVRIVEGDQVRPDVEAMYLRRSRLPTFMKLDLRAQIGANNVARSRIQEVGRRYGALPLRSSLLGMIDLVEHQLRSRLASLPQTSFRETVLLDDDGVDPNNIYAIVLDIENGPDGLTLDFSASSPQAGALVNCTRAGLMGGVMAGLMPLLCYDMPWTPGGVERCLQVISKPGTIVDAEWPAGVCGASIAASRAAVMVVTSAIGRLLADSDELRARSSSGWPGGIHLGSIQGVDDEGRLYSATLSETGQGGAAYLERDGLDSGGGITSLATAVPNVERNELTWPILYLFRREDCDSGGPGRTRGGVGTAIAVQVLSKDGAVVTCPGMGFACPGTFGLAGGRPGRRGLNATIAGAAPGDMGTLRSIATSLNGIWSSATDLPPGKVHALAGQGLEGAGLTIEAMRAKGEVAMQVGDVFASRGGSGAGYGDPRRRNVSAVLEDVAQGHVSAEGAEREYGVRVNFTDQAPTGQRIDPDQPPDRPVDLERWATIGGASAVWRQGYQHGECVKSELVLERA